MRKRNVRKKQFCGGCDASRCKLKGGFPEDSNEFPNAELASHFNMKNIFFSEWKQSIISWARRMGGERRKARANRSRKCGANCVGDFFFTSLWATLTTSHKAQPTRTEQHRVSKSYEISLHQVLRHKHHKALCRRAQKIKNKKVNFDSIHKEHKLKLLIFFSFLHKYKLATQSG
jgi:hypothetical protein